MNKLIKAGNSARTRATTFAILALAAAGSAMAQEATTPDAGVQAITDLQDKATTYIAAAFAVAVLVAGGFWGIKMMKKSFGAAK